MLITFEGIDGCGKTTQMKQLEQYFENSGKDVLTLREPGGTELSEQIRDILLDSKGVISTMSELLLFAAARAQLVENIIRPAIAAGTIVLCDRFYDSTTAYQGYGRGLPLEDVAKINQIATGGLVPNITFFLNISLDESKIRSHNRYRDRIEKAGDAFFERVLHGFHTIADNEPDRFHIVDAGGSFEQTSRKILSVITKLV